MKKSGSEYTKEELLAIMLNTIKKTSNEVRGTDYELIKVKKNKKGKKQK